MSDHELPEDEFPSSRLPPLPTEVRLARLEDPSFAETLGRARAKARNVEYRPELHYPYRPGGTRRAEDTDNLDRFEALMDEWNRRAPFNPYLRAVR